MHHVVHDLVDLRRDLVASHICQDGKISARYVEADAAERNSVFVSDYAADRLRVTFMAIGAKHAALPSRRHASLDLFDRCFVVLAKNFRLRLHQYRLVQPRTGSKDFNQLFIERLRRNHAPSFHFNAITGGQHTAHRFDRVENDGRKRQPD